MSQLSLTRKKNWRHELKKLEVNHCYKLHYNRTSCLTSVPEISLPRLFLSSSKRETRKQPLKAFSDTSGTFLPPLVSFYPYHWPDKQLRKYHCVKNLPAQSLGSVARRGEITQMLYLV